MHSCLFVQHRTVQIGLKETAKNVFRSIVYRLKEKNLSKQWLIKLGRDKKFLPKVEHLYVCSDHFTEDRFEVDHRHSLLGGKTRKRKKKTDVVPTIFKKSVSIKKRAASERRLASKRRKEVSYISFFK